MWAATSRHVKYAWLQKKKKKNTLGTRDADSAGGRGPVMKGGSEAEGRPKTTSRPAVFPVKCWPGRAPPWHAQERALVHTGQAGVCQSGLLCEVALVTFK